MLFEKLSSSQSASADRQYAGTPRGLTSTSYRIIDLIPLWKRVVDLIACAVALPVLGLCTLAMTIVTKCVSPGPVFFRQTRIGYLGRRFKIYKFRTMHVDADCIVHQNHLRNLIGSNAPMTKLDDNGDARLIPGAWLLRASGLDELPQIINVFLGEMSLVGPRPCLPAEYDQFGSRERQRSEALPGLTGLWQVSGKNHTTFTEMIDLDVRYTREFSPWLDLKIIFMTLPCLLMQVLESRHARKSSPKPAPSQAVSVPIDPQACSPIVSVSVSVGS